MRVVAAGAYVLPAIAANAVLQALLVLPDPTAEASVGFLLGALASGLVALATYAVLVATTVSPDASAMKHALRVRGLRFAAWTIALTVLVVIGTAFFLGVPGYVIAAVSVYLPIAAMSAGGNPLAAGFSAIGRRPLAYLLRLLLTIIVAAVVFVQAAVTSFFVGGAAATAITMVVIGLLAWWLTRVWSTAFARATLVAADSP